MQPALPKQLMWSPRLHGREDRLIDESSAACAGRVARNDYDQIARGHDIYQLSSDARGEVCGGFSRWPGDPPEITVIRGADRRSTVVVLLRGLGDIRFRNELHSIPTSAAQIQAADFRHVTRGEGEPGRPLQVTLVIERPRVVLYSKGSKQMLLGEAARVLPDRTGQNN